MNEIEFRKPQNKKGRKPRLYMVLDCETATLPFVRDMQLSEIQRKNVAIARPLIYDIGWRIIDAKGNVYSQHSFLIQETFFVPSVFNTAYYRDKRPLYMEDLKNGEIIVKNWDEATNILVSDLARVDAVCAYNAMFDFKKALGFTDEYIAHLYSWDYNIWEDRQKRICKEIAEKKKYDNPREFDPINFNFRGVDYPMIDIWGEVCRKMINSESYRKMCLREGWLTQSGLYFKTSAEKTFAYLMHDIDFVEAHTALADAIIESELLVKFLRSNKAKIGLTYFPFREVGNVYDYLVNSGVEYVNYKEEREKSKKRTRRKPPVPVESYNNAIVQMIARIQGIEGCSTFAVNLSEKVFRLDSLGKQIYKDYEQVTNTDLARAVMLYNFFEKKAKAEQDPTKAASYNYCADMMFDLIDSYKG